MSTTLMSQYAAASNEAVPSWDFGNIRATQDPDSDWETSERMQGIETSEAMQGVETSLFGGDPIPSIETDNVGNDLPVTGPSSAPGTGLLPRGFSNESDGGLYDSEAERRALRRKGKAAVVVDSGAEKRGLKRKGKTAVVVEEPYPDSDSSDDLDIPEPFKQTAYSLREGGARAKRIPTTWLDQDRSGNYDPEQEKLEARKRRKGKQTEKKKKTKVKKLIVKLAIEDMGTVRNITDDTDNWPRGHSIVSSIAAEDTQSSFSSVLVPHKPTPAKVPQKPIEDPKGELADLTGHPSAAGCVHCRKISQSCSIVRTGKFPCEECVSDGLEKQCQLIVEPKRKTTCRQCEAEGILCSYKQDPTLRGPCMECQGSLQDCTPVPAEDEQIRIPMDKFCGSDRKHITCTNCRQNKKRCSLKKKEDMPPCNYCKKNNIGCTFEDLPKPLDPPKKKSGKSSKKLDKGKGKAKEEDPPSTAADQSNTTQTKLNNHPSMFTAADWESDEESYVPVERAATPSIELVDAAGHAGKTTSIMTSFCHPIEFNVPVGKVRNCSFCASPFFRFVGHFERQVTVLEWNNGLGYTEIGGGFIDTEKPTKMCMTCTESRLQIIMCPGHEIAPIKMNGSLPSIEDVVDELCEIKPRSEGGTWFMQRFCTFCFSLAEFRCDNNNGALLGDAGEGDKLLFDGCGLRLCKACEVKLRETYDGDVQLMVAAFDKMPKPRDGDEVEVKVRADVGFLLEHGLMMKNLCAQMDEYSIGAGA